MPSYMEGYGAGEERRWLWIKRVLFIGLPSVLVIVSAFFYFRTWSQERTVSNFFETLEQQNYEAAYRMWCTPEKPCRYYPIEKFKEDWGTDGVYGNLSALKIENVDYCESGVVLEATYPDTQPFGLWVERSTNMISFAPWQRCPGKHIQFGPFLKRIFG
jgi:hypothetical protein